MEAQMRITEVEKDYIRNTFKDREDLLKLLRKVFLKRDIAEEDIKEAQVFNSEVGKSLIKKMFLPEYDFDMALGANTDLWRALEIKDKPAEYVQILSEATHKISKHLKTVLDRLDGTSFDAKNFIEIEFSPIEDTHENNVALMARNELISLVEFKIVEIWVIAIKTDAELSQLRARNSAK